MSGYTKEMLEWSNYLCTSAHPSRMQTWLPGGTESTFIVGLPVLHQGHPNSGKCCIVLESGPTRSLVAKLPQRLSHAVHELCAATKNATNEAMDECVRNFDAGCGGA